MNRGQIYNPTVTDNFLLWVSINQTVKSYHPAATIFVYFENQFYRYLKGLILEHHQKSRKRLKATGVQDFRKCVKTVSSWILHWITFFFLFRLKKLGWDVMGLCSAALLVDNSTLHYYYFFFLNISFFLDKNISFFKKEKTQYQPYKKQQSCKQIEDNQSSATSQLISYHHYLISLSKKRGMFFL